MEIAMSKMCKVCVEAEIWPPPQQRSRGQNNPHLSDTYGRITRPIGVIDKPEWKFSRTGHLWEMNLEPSISSNFHLEAEIFPLPWKPRKIRSAARAVSENFSTGDAGLMVGNQSWLRYHCPSPVVQQQKVLWFYKSKTNGFEVIDPYVSGGGGHS